jgi:hypothetical protein
MKYIFKPNTVPSTQNNGSLAEQTFLTPPIWKEKFSSQLNVASAHECIDGTTLFQISPLDGSGATITLEFSGDNGAVTAEQAVALLAAADAGIPVIFNDGEGNEGGGTNYNVIFDYTKNNPVDLKPFDINRAVYIGTIYLRRVT